MKRGKRSNLNVSQKLKHSQQGKDGEVDTQDDAQEGRGWAVGAALIWTMTVGVVLACQVPFVYEDVPGGDAGELLAEACLHGVAHPPGYPLFLILTRGFVDLVSVASPGSCGNWAWCANLFSVLCGACASGFVGLSVFGFYVFLLHANPTDWLLGVSSVCAGVMFSLSPLVWAYTVSAEVFALNNCICSILIFITISVTSLSSSRKRTMGIGIGAVFAGFGLSNQHTSVLYLVPLVGYILFVVDRPIVIGKWFIYGVCGLVGLSPNLYLVLTARNPKPGSWGDTSSLDGFVTHFLRREYGTLQLAPTAHETEGMVERTFLYFADIVEEQHVFGVVILSFVFYVLVTQLRRSHGLSRKCLTVLVTTLGFYLVVFHSLANLSLSTPMSREVHRRFWIQPHLLICIIFGLGLVQFGKPMGKLFIVLVLGFLAGAIGVRLHDARSLASTAVGLYSDAILHHLPENALLASHTDINWNGVRYKQACTNARPDVTHLSFQLMPYPWFATNQQPLYPNVAFPPIKHPASTDRKSQANADMVVSFAKANVPKFSGGVFIDMHSIDDTKLGKDNSYFGVHLLPYGLVWKVVERVDDVVLRQWNQQTKKIMDNIFQNIQLGQFTLTKGTWEFAVSSIMWDALYQRALFLLSSSMDRIESKKAEKYGTQALHESTHILQQCILHGTTETNGTITFTMRDITRNAALASVRNMEKIRKMKTDDKSQYRPALSAAEFSIGKYLQYGDSVKDPAYPKFQEILAAVQQTISNLPPS